MRYIVLTLKVQVTPLFIWVLSFVSYVSGMIIQQAVSEDNELPSHFIKICYSDASCSTLI
jgi:hypothetical protein